MKCRILDSVTENSFPSDKTWIILYFICQEGSGRGEGSMGGVEEGSGRGEGSMGG